MNHQAKAKLFMHGRSQAVRLPKEFRMEGTEVNIRKEGESLIIDPVRKRRSLEEMFAYIDSLPGDGYEDGWRQQPDWPPPRENEKD